LFYHIFKIKNHLHFFLKVLIFFLLSIFSLFLQEGVKISDVEIVILAMDTCLGSVGGVCCGSREIVDHQRLSGAGYCFSAAGPPFLSAAATQALLELENDKGAKLKDLRKAAALMAVGLKKIKGIEVITSLPSDSPIMHFKIDSALQLTRDQEEHLVTQISRRCIELGTGITTCKFSLVHNELNCQMHPSLRVCVTANLSAKQIEKATADIEKAINDIFLQVRKKCIYIYNIYYIYSCFLILYFFIPFIIITRV